MSGYFGFLVDVDIAEVAAKLEREGVASFQKSFDELLAALSAKTAELLK